ncbi:MAG: AbrB/MazE/SpoVT family DNA-binding domain-containing protein [Oscillospiraceae bacterium]|nr:AbrB/MazE/SpoVT family DNA-binding domain-containing protein [Oscillospiraceae bacterium]
MKSTGIVRKIDELGRIVLPIELRRTMSISDRDSVEIFVEGSSIVLKKFIPQVGKGKKHICEICKREMEI